MGIVRIPKKYYIKFLMLCVPGYKRVFYKVRKIKEQRLKEKQKEKIEDQINEHNKKIDDKRREIHLAKIRSAKKHNNTKINNSNSKLSNQQLIANQQRKMELEQGIENEGKKLGMLITTIENINKPFTPVGLVMSESNVMEQSLSKNILSNGLGINGLEGLQAVLTHHLVRDTREKGGNAVIGLRIFMQPGGEGFIAYGTAIKIN